MQIPCRAWKTWTAMRVPSSYGANTSRPCKSRRTGGASGTRRSQWHTAEPVAHGEGSGAKINEFLIMAAVGTRCAWNRFSIVILCEGPLISAQRCKSYKPI